MGLSTGGVGPRLRGGFGGGGGGGDSGAGRGGEAGGRRTLDGVAEFVYESRPDAEVMPHVVEVLGVGGGGGVIWGGNIRATTNALPS